MKTPSVAPRARTSDVGARHARLVARRALPNPQSPTPPSSRIQPFVSRLKHSKKLPASGPAFQACHSPLKPRAFTRACAVAFAPRMSRLENGDGGCCVRACVQVQCCCMRSSSVLLLNFLFVSPSFLDFQSVRTRILSNPTSICIMLCIRWTLIRIFKALRLSEPPAGCQAIPRALSFCRLCFSPSRLRFHSCGGRAAPPPAPHLSPLPYWYV
jgi:hypothetical protein